MNVQIIVLAKTPVPGRVKTRLCPPWTHRQAACLAAAALQDTLDVVSATEATRRVLVVEGDLPAPGGWCRIPQRGTGLGERIAHAFADAAEPGTATLLIGMDTPQISRELLTSAAREMTDPATAAVLGPAQDGGWWLLGLNDPGSARALRDVPVSTPGTGALTIAALRGQGLEPTLLTVLRDVDTAEDAHAVAALCPPGSHFARTLATVSLPGDR